MALLGFFCLALFSCGGGDNPTAPTPTAPAATTTPSASPSPTPASSRAPPGRDLLDLARRFRGLPADSARLARSAPYAQQVGDSQEFIVIDLDTPAVTTISATLSHITDHAYFFVQDGIQTSASTLEAVGFDFEAAVYPGVTAAFSGEWSPGVDSDPRIAILHADLVGAGGYFSQSDEFPRAVVSHSNEREMVYVDRSALSAGAAYNALLGHELQHLIHWNADPDEEAWVNEGLSQVAAQLVAGTGDVSPFLTTPDTQLNDWPAANGGVDVHYAASQLFFGYLLDRFGGRQRAADLVRQAGDGIEGVNAYLKPFNATFEQVFSDWAIANYLDEPSGPYSHLSGDYRVTTVTTINAPGQGDGSVHQFAADYLEIEAPAGATFTFDGSDEVGINIAPRNGPFWWSQRGDGIDSRMTRELDLSGLERATLRFWTWFDSEEGWDYAYVAASSDGGRTWQALPGLHTTAHDPIGLAYGLGYTGASGQNPPGMDSGDLEPAWVQEEVDLTPLAGQKVLLRFEYITDDAANLRGFAVDDIEVPELGLSDGADDDGPWQAEGFIRVQAPAQQRFILHLIRRGEPDSLQRIDLDGANRADIPLDGPSTIVIATATEETTELASYHWSLASP